MKIAVKSVRFMEMSILKGFTVNNFVEKADNEICYPALGVLGYNVNPFSDVFRQ